MRQTLSRGMVAAAAATGILSLCGNPVYADSLAEGATNDSPGVASGNTIQIPVNIPINACGNSVDVIGLLNPTFGNSCANDADTPEAPAVPVAADAPPAAPVEHHHTPNGGHFVHHRIPPQRSEHRPPSTPATPHTDVIPSTFSHQAPALAETGSEDMIAASAVSVALLAGGLILYRRARVSRW
ncbi:chaplin [Streptomyces sp. NPDC052051]|uniref:chaplin n=1 Tax=Streptomyces sp. NPDC052051 TaxID=3154649 RepID=UPI003419D9EC